MEKYRLFAQRIGLIGITQVLIALNGFIVIAIFTKLLSIDDYGAWVQLIVTIGFLAIVGCLGLPLSLMRHMAAQSSRIEIRETFYSIFFLVAAFCLAIAAALYLFSPYLNAILFDHISVMGLFLPVIFFLECTIGICGGYFRALQQIKRYSGVLLVKTFSLTVFATFLIVTGSGIFGALLAFVCVDFLIALYCGYAIGREIGFAIPTFKNIREHLSFGLPTIPGDFAYLVVNSSNRYIIGIFLGVSAVGYFNPGYTLGMIVTVFLSPLVLLLPAVLSESFDLGKIEDTREMLRYSLKYFLFLSIPSAFGLTVLSKQILSYFSTQEIAINSYYIIPFVTIGAILLGVFLITTQFFILWKKTRIIGITWTVAAILNIIFNLILIPIAGLLGAAIASLASFGVPFLIGIYYSFSEMKKITDVKFIGKSIFASLLMTIVIWVISPQNLVTLLLAIISGMIVYAGSMWLLKAISRNEIMFFKNLYTSIEK